MADVLIGRPFHQSAHSAVCHIHLRGASSVSSSTASHVSYSRVHPPSLQLFAPDYAMEPTNAASGPPVRLWGFFWTAISHGSCRVRGPATTTAPHGWVSWPYAAAAAAATPYGRLPRSDAAAPAPNGRSPWPDTGAAAPGGRLPRTHAAATASNGRLPWPNAATAAPDGRLPRPDAATAAASGWNAWTTNAVPAAEPTTSGD